LPSASVERLNPLNGDRVFSAPIGGATPVEAHAVTTDVLSNVYVVGKTSESLDGNQPLGGADIVIVRFNDAGQKQ